MSSHPSAANAARTRGNVELPAVQSASGRSASPGAGVGSGAGSPSKRPGSMAPSRASWNSASLLSTYR